MIYLIAVCGLAVIYLALKCAPHMGQGLLKAVLSGKVMSEPFKISLCKDSFKCVLAFMAVYAAAAGVLTSSASNERPGREFGSAAFSDAAAMGKKYTSPDDNCKILTERVSLSLDSNKTGRNLNVLVCGGSGSGKTRFFAKPNIMQCADASMVILDCKGELLRSTGTMLKDKGYEIKVLDLINMDRSDGYNPFMYLKDDNDAQKMVTNLFENTTPKDAKASDPFWDQTAKMLLMALVLYLKHEAPDYEQNFSTVLKMIRCGDVSEEHSETPSVLDEVFERLRKKDPDHIALRYYDSYRSASGKTLKSIQITLLSHLEKFDLGSLASLTCHDDMDLRRLGYRKTALFAVIPDNDTSFNFIVGMLYTQLFQILYYEADSVCGGKLPLHVHFLMDEFANVSIPSSFDKLLATMRSRGISVSIIIQNMAQLKKLFDKEWESVVGNCDSFLYLGGNELSTHEYVSKLMGKETIDVKSFSKSSGRGGSYSRSVSRQGTELMAPGEVRTIDNSKALLFIRGENAVMDGKYNLTRHKNYPLISDGGAREFTHGEDRVSFMSFTYDSAGQLKGRDNRRYLPYLFISRDELIGRYEKGEDRL